MLGEMSLGTVKVMTTSNRGFTADEIAERALDRILYIGDQAHPTISAQAHAFRENIRQVLVRYLNEMAQNERVTMAAKLRDAGHPELVNIL